MTLDARYTIPSSIMLQVVDDETLLFNSENGQFFTLNEVGTVMWEEITAHTTLQSVLSEMLEIFDVASEQLSNDLFAFAESLSQQGLFVVGEGSEEGKGILVE